MNNSTSRGHGSKLVRLITPATAGTYTGADGKTYPMAADRSIEVPEEFVSALIVRGYVLGGKPDSTAVKSHNPGNSAPDAIAKLMAPAGAHSVGAGGREYPVAEDGTVDVEFRDVAQLLSVGCQYYVAPRGR